MTIEPKQFHLKLREKCLACGQTRSQENGKIINDFAYQSGIFMGMATRREVTEFLDSKNFSRMKQEALLSLLKDLSKVFYE